MKSALLTALLCAAAAVTTACSAGGPPDRAVVPTPRPVVLTMANGLTDSEELGTFVHEVSVLTGGTVRIDVRSHWRACEDRLRERAHRGRPGGPGGPRGGRQPGVRLSRGSQHAGA